MKFAAIWPRAWIDLIVVADASVKPFGKLGIDAMAIEWADGLAGLNGDDIKRGIEHCRREMPWPPTIAEFRKACLGGATAEQRAFAARAEQEKLTLPSKTWAETKEAGAIKAQATKAIAKQGKPMRTQRNINNGTWTREMEAVIRRDMGLLGIKYEEIDWPCDQVNTEGSRHVREYN